MTMSLILAARYVRGDAGLTAVFIIAIIVWLLCAVLAGVGLTSKGIMWVLLFAAVAWSILI